jgi:hypothetical protein
VRSFRAWPVLEDLVCTAVSAGSHGLPENSHTKNCLSVNIFLCSSKRAAGVAEGVGITEGSGLHRRIRKLEGGCKAGTGSKQGTESTEGGKPSIGEKIFETLLNRGGVRITYIRNKCRGAILFERGWQHLLLCLC